MKVSDFLNKKNQAFITEADFEIITSPTYEGQRNAHKVYVLKIYIYAKFDK